MPRRLGMLLSATLVASAVATALVAPSGNRHEPAAAAGRPAAKPVVAAEGLGALPWETLTDWTSYSDYVVDAVATTEARSRPSADEIASGQGLAVRLVTLKVDRVLWSAAKPHARPESLIIPNGGWLFKTGEAERQLVLPDSVTFEAGHHYLIPIFYDETFTPAWQGLYASAILPFDNGQVGQGETLFGDDRKPVVGTNDTRPSRRNLWGKSATAVAAALTAAKPDPEALANAGLPPAARYQKVLHKK